MNPKHCGEYVRKQKAELEKGLREEISKQMRWFEEDTGSSIERIDVNMVDITGYGHPRMKLIVDSVHCVVSYEEAEMESTFVTSSNIERLGYENQTLYVQFKNGTFYRYEGVDREVYHFLIGSESVGKAFNQFVKTKYPFQKLDTTPF